MTSTSHAEDEYVTIIARSVADAMQQFKARGLDDQGYAIAGRVGRHQFAMVDQNGCNDLFDGDKLVAATWVRKAGC